MNNDLKTKKQHLKKKNQEIIKLQQSILSITIKVENKSLLD